MRPPRTARHATGHPSPLHLWHTPGKHGKESDMISSAERTRVAKALEREVQEWVLRGFKPAYGKLTERFESHPRWRALQRAGTEPWLDTGDIEGSRKLWTREFRALTTNNTLLNKEVP